MRQIIQDTEIEENKLEGKMFNKRVVYETESESED